MTSNIKVIDYQARQVTYNIYCYFKERKKNKNSKEHKEDINLIDLISEATSLSKSTVTRIIREGNAMKLEDGEAIFKPKDKKKHIRKKRILINEITEATIRRKVIQFYTVKNEVPSIRKLNKLLKQESILKCSDEYLRRLLHNLGFTNAESDAKGMLREREDIVTQRLGYLKALKGFREHNRDVFYLNETKRWKNENITNEEATNTEVLNDVPTFVMVNANSGAGFLDGTQIMMKAKTETEPNFEYFENYDWVKDTVLKNIPAQSVIVINIPYCETAESFLRDEQPTMASTRASMEEWLSRHQIPFSGTGSKSDLLNLVKRQEELIEYSITKIISEKGHEVLCLPENHSDLNPVFIVWEEIKKCAIKTPQESLSSYPQDKWLEKFEQVKQNEAEYFSHDIKADDVDHIKQLKREVLEEELIIKSESDDGESMDCDYL